MNIYLTLVVYASILARPVTKLALEGAVDPDEIGYIY